jgi:ribonuclease BN (tRNA processing enzyme)
MTNEKTPLDLLFLGSGNAFGAQGRAFSSFLLNGRYLFDCGPTVLQQLRKADVSHTDIDAVFVSHFHADHFFGLPFLFLASRYEGRTRDITVVGPPGIEERTAGLMSLGYPHLLDDAPYGVNFIEVSDGFSGAVSGLEFSAARVDHVEQLMCFAYRAEPAGRSIVYSGDTTLCGGLLRLSKGADVIVLECSCDGVPVHLSPEGVEEVARHAPDAQIVLTHLDGLQDTQAFPGYIVAEDLGRYRF